MKGIKDYIDQKVMKLFQAHVDERLLTQVAAQRIKDKISWRELVSACFKRYLDESKGKPK